MRGDGEVSMQRQQHQHKRQQHEQTTRQDSPKILARENTRAPRNIDEICAEVMRTVSRAARTSRAAERLTYSPE